MHTIIKITTLLVALSALFLLQSCATLFRSPSPNEFSINTEPEGARVYIDGFPVGTTPVRTYLKPKKQYVVEIRKKGYQTHIETVESKVVIGWLALDLLSIVYILPPIIDASTGAWYEPKDDMLFRELIPLNDSDTLQSETKPQTTSTLNSTTYSNPKRFIPAKVPLEPIIALISAGYTLPSPYGSEYAAFIPTSFGIGFGYKVDSSLAVGVSFESTGTRKNVYYTSFFPNDSLVKRQIFPNITTISIDARYRFGKSAMYGLAGIGGLVVNNDEEEETFTGSGSIPEFSEMIAGCSVGMGIVLKGGGFFGETRYTFGLQNVNFAPYKPFSTGFFTIKFGYYFDGL